MKPAAYWRQASQWKNLLHKEGIVLQATHIVAPSHELAVWGSYSYALVRIDGNVWEFPGVPGEVLSKGDTVRCVLRKLEPTTHSEPISYGLKVKKL